MQYVAMNRFPLQEQHRHIDPWVNAGELTEYKLFLFESGCFHMLTLHTDIWAWYF